MGIKVTATGNNYPITAAELENTLEIVNENAPVKIEKLRGNCELKNENGAVKLSEIEGNLEIEQENGVISAIGISGAKLKLETENGMVKLRECQVNEVDISSENGAVYYECKPIPEGAIKICSENGPIHLVLSPGQGYTLTASTENGVIRNTLGVGECCLGGGYSSKSGDEKLIITLENENGPIKISSAVSADSEYLKSKFEHLRDMLKDYSEDKFPQIEQFINTLSESLNKAVNSISEESVREKLKVAVEEIQTWKESLMEPEKRAEIIIYIDSLSKDFFKTLHDVIKEIKIKIHHDLKEPLHEFKSKFKNFKFDFGQFKHFDKFGHHHPHEHQGMRDKSRMKILEMLEAGKITAEEAERLLKAIT